MTNPQLPFAEDWFETDKLHFAAQDGNYELCVQRLAEGFTPNRFDDLGNTPLHYAAAEGHIEVVKLLLAHGADVNAHHEPKIGNTPLAEIADDCSLEMAKLLLEAGADPTIPGWMQMNALHHAEKRKRGDGPKVYQLLCKYASRKQF